MATWYYIKNRKAQNENDFETWIESDVAPTLNVFENAGDVRATVLIIDGTRVNDVRVYDDEVMQTVIQRWGTGGGNVPLVAYSFDSLSSNSMKSANPNSGCRDVEISQTLLAGHPDPAKNQGGMAVLDDLNVRRLTPTECERLQGFPDGWTDEQSDTQRYRQMGNAVTVNVVEWIGKRIMEQENG